MSLSWQYGGICVTFDFGNPLVTHNSQTCPVVFGALLLPPQSLFLSSEVWTDQPRSHGAVAAVAAGTKQGSVEKIEIFLWGIIMRHQISRKIHSQIEQFINLLKWLWNRMHACKLTTLWFWVQRVRDTLSSPAFVTHKKSIDKYVRLKQCYALFCVDTCLGSLGKKYRLLKIAFDRNIRHIAS